MEIENSWGEIARKCVGKKIIEVELASIAQILRVVFDNDITIELASCWRYSTKKSILIGALDLGFSHITPDSEEDMNALIEDQDVFHYKKLNSLVGRILNNITFKDTEIVLDISGNRTIEWFCLSRDELGFRAINNS